MNRNYWACICGISFAGILCAQNPPGPTVTIRFGDDSKRLVVAQFMFRKPDGAYLPQGASGGYVVGSLPIPRPTDRPTDQLKVRVWTSGCAMKMFDIPLADADVAVQFVCDAEKTVTLRGRVVGLSQHSTISALYRGRCVNSWIDERETSQCGFPVLEATANLEADGSFTIELPDFNADPIVSSDTSAGFKFFVKTPDGTLQLVKPEGARDPWITVASSYPDDVRFALAK